MSRFSLRVRLIVAIGLLLATALVVFDLAFYSLLAEQLARDLDNSLRVSAAEVASALSPDRDENMDTDDIRPGVLEPMAVDDASRPGVYVQIVDVDGHVIATSGTRLPLDRARIRHVLTGAEDLDWAGTDERLRMLSRPVVATDGGIVGVVQVAQSARFLDRALAEVRTLIVVGSTLTLVGTLAVGWLLVGRALRPITELTAAADHIVATGRLDARIQPAGPVASTDEVGTLVRSFNSMIERLAHSFEQQQRLLADTSHELRNPLTAIRANLEIIEGMEGLEGVDGLEGADGVERMERVDALFEAAGEAKSEALRMSRLVNDLLLLAQTDTTDVIERQPVDLASLVERVADRARLMSPSHHVETLLLESPRRVVGDADRLYQAVWNLVDNAIRWTPAGGRIWLRLRWHDDHVAIEVDDTGPGIAMEHQPRVFERLYRADASRSRRSGGAGLGLAIVKWVAEAHDGYVTLTSTPGEGSLFKIVLPVDRLTPAPDDARIRMAVPAMRRF